MTDTTMALFDFLKRKKETEKAKPIKKSAKKAEKVLVTSVRRSPKDEGDKKPASAKAMARRGGFSYEIVKAPHISEKATNLSENNQYVFKVIARSNKTEIKKSIEGIYGVNVLSVNIIKIPAKKRRIGKIQGFKKGHTKAVVKVADGQKIEIL